MKRISDIDLRLLRVFVAVAEARGFAAAETYLNLSTSTISVHISNLEQRLGMRLCERGRGGFKLTVRGKTVYEETKALFKSLDDYAGKLAATKSQLAGKLTIGIVDGLITCPDFLVSEAVREFNSVENEVDIELVVGPRQLLEHDVISGQIHAGVGPFIRDLSGLDFTYLFSENHSVYCGKGHLLFGVSEKLSRKVDLSIFPAIVRQYHNDFDKTAFGSTSVSAQVNTMEGMLTLLLSGGYVGFLPDHYARTWVEKGVLSKIDNENATYSSKHMIITKTGKRESLALEIFLNHLKMRTRKDQASNPEAAD